MADKPPVNEVARIVNSHFLQSPYEGKDWDSVRTDLITEFNKQLTKSEQKMFNKGVRLTLNMLVADGKIKPYVAQDLGQFLLSKGIITDD